MTPCLRPVKVLLSSFVALTLVFHLTSLCVILLNSLTFALTSEPFHHYHDYCIIGAGPGGLQMGYFLERANRDYLIFERSNISGSFFAQYPRHRKLISINKRYTGKTNKEFNLRHDWNSLLSDDESLLLREYSKEMFPHADVLLQYLRDYQHRLGLKVQFDTDVRNVRNVDNASAPDGVLHQFEDQRGLTYTCKVLVIATGMWKPNIPDVKGIELAEGYEDMTLEPEQYEGKSVLILGRGNAAFEVADSIYGVTNLIHMISRSRVRLSWETHYVGDLRAVNNALLDTYQLKSLDGLLEAGLASSHMVKTKDNQIVILPKSTEKNYSDDLSFKMEDNFALREPYDKVIRCLGFQFDADIFQKEEEVKRGKGRVSKYPLIKYNYESVALPGVFFAGTNTHSLDFRKSAGGFIHGFRYTARALWRLLEWRYEGVQWAHQHLPVSQLVNRLLKRVNEASGLYQMFHVLADVIVFSQDKTTFDYYEEFPAKLLHDFYNRTGSQPGSILVLILEYGPDFSGPGKDIFRYDRATGEPSDAHNSNFLHPKLYYYERLPTVKEMARVSKKETLPRPAALHHMVEDFLTLWDGVLSHIAPLRHFLDHILNSDLRPQFAEACFAEAMTHQHSRPFCRDNYLAGMGVTSPGGKEAV